VTEVQWVLLLGMLMKFASWLGGFVRFEGSGSAGNDVCDRPRGGVCQLILDGIALVRAAPRWCVRVTPGSPIVGIHKVNEIRIVNKVYSLYLQR
jgi:hypothetical protein